MSKNNGRPYRTKRVLQGLDQGQAWEILYKTLEEIRNYEDGVCARCGENIRVQGSTICLECLEEELLEIEE